MSQRIGLAPSIDETNATANNNDRLVEPSCSNEVEGDLLELDYVDELNEEDNEAGIEQEEIRQHVQSDRTRCIFVKHYHPCSIPYEVIKEYILEIFYPLMGELIREPIMYRNTDFDDQMGCEIYRENYIFRFQFAVPKQEVQNIVDTLIYYGDDYMQEIILYVRVNNFYTYL